MITVYGIPNCDTMKKARKWLNHHGIEYQFHDYRKNGLTQAFLKKVIAELGWETMINRRGSTWRKLDEATRESLNQSNAIALMLEQPAIIKRPLIDTGNGFMIGFNVDEFEQVFVSA
ncbi:MAG: ArsC family reductase [Gammaproteobacteria bacterium]|nr:ArsC family reductase [Gammaproteobacteria bacterium]MDH5731502.1 ArsC family reductase [Gammaproteobacteria bacterium]